MTSFHRLLMQPTWRAQELERAKEELNERAGSSQGMVASYSGMGGLGGGGGVKDSALVATVALVDAVKQARSRLFDAEHVLHGFLLQLATVDERSALLLKYRYLYRLEWAQVRECMARKGYRAKTERTIFNWHKAARLRGGDLWKEHQERAENDRTGTQDN